MMTKTGFRTRISINKESHEGIEPSVNQAEKKEEVNLQTPRVDLQYLLLKEALD